MYNTGKQLTTRLSYMGQNVNGIYIFGYLGAPGRPPMIRLVLFCFTAIVLPIATMYMSNNEVI